MHTYTAQLRIEGVGLDPDEVARVIGLSPTQIRYAGHTCGTRTFEPMWGYSGQDDRDWPSLEEALRYVLADLQPHAEVIRSNFAAFDTYWWCGHFTSSFDGGPTLSSELLLELGRFGARLILDTYRNSTDE